MSEFYSTLLSWAVSLSGLAAPIQEPVVIQVPHRFFVEQACGGKECAVLGWYAGGRNLYVDDSLDPEHDLHAASIVVHEMVHYLQGTARHNGLPAAGAAYLDEPSCVAALQMERDAYLVQRRFLFDNGSAQSVGMPLWVAGCKN